MKIVIATGIYPPTIGGTATYAYELTRELRKKGHEVSVVTYAPPYHDDGIWRVPSHGGIIARWWRYAKILKSVGKDADVVIALSSVSTGIPLMMARLTKPKKILRLGGDFFWERYTDAGGMKSLKDWYASGNGFWKMMNRIFMGHILRSFDQLVYSTEMQRSLHEKHYRSLPPSLILENAVPSNAPQQHSLHQPMKLLCMSRFVRFKNLSALLDAVSRMEGVTLTMIGSGPMRNELHALSEKLDIDIYWRGPTSEKEAAFKDHDLLVIPSTTEISPNTALEARSYGLPVLLSEENGLSGRLLSGMVVAPLLSSEQIVGAIENVRNQYDHIATEAASKAPERTWSHVADDWITLLSS